VREHAAPLRRIVERGPGGVRLECGHVIQRIGFGWSGEKAERKRCADCAEDMLGRRLVEMAQQALGMVGMAGVEPVWNRGRLNFADGVHAWCRSEESITVEADHPSGDPRLRMHVGHGSTSAEGVAVAVAELVRRRIVVALGEGK
jgi:hypothetical protein